MVLLCLLALTPVAAIAQSWPSRPITIVVSFGAGGTADILARLPGLMGESTLGTFAALQFTAALRKPLLPAELTWFLAMTEQITTLSPTIADGMVEMPQACSLASIVDWSALRRYSV